VSLAGVLDDQKIVLCDDGQNLVQIRRDTKDMNGQDGARVLRDAVFNVVVVRVDLKRFQVRIRKDWQRGT